MLNNNKIIAIIPARSGSKRLKNKNILTFASKPLIFWTIEKAINSKYIDKVVFSSDSKKYLNLVKKKFKTVYLDLRQSKLATDTTPTKKVISNILKKNKEFNTTILLQPTSPLRDNNDIDLSLLKFFKTKKNH